MKFFVIEIDKNDQILALDFGCLEICFYFIYLFIYFFLQNLVGWLINICSSQQLWSWRAVKQFLSSVTESAVGKERP